LRQGKPLTPSDLNELEKMLLDAGIAEASDIERARQTSQGFGRFVRSLVGLDRTAVSEAFGEFLATGTATAAQIEFINMVIEHLTDQGVMDPGLLYEPPFTDIAPTGPESCLMRKRWRGCSPRFGPSMTVLWLEVSRPRNRTRSFEIPVRGKFARKINLICPVQPLSQKYSPFRITQISSRSASVPPPRGAVARRHERGEGCGGRGSVGAKRQSQGGFSRERKPARGRTAFQRLRQSFGWRHMAGCRLGGGRCVRRSRVVLASVADVKSAEARQPNRVLTNLNPQTRVTKRNSSPGSNCVLVDR
jgi:EcoEI R protein C-terminal